MKKLSVLGSGLILLSVLSLSSCEKEDEYESEIPQNFSIDIPTAISNDGSDARLMGDDTIRGSEIYEPLTGFIRVGEQAAEVVQDIMRAIRTYHLSKAQEFSFTSSDDSRTKNVVITEEVNRNGVDYEFELIMTDQDGETAMQVVWNTNPVEGIAVISPYDLDHSKSISIAETKYRVDYNESPSNSNYETTMEVYISGFPLGDVDPFEIDNLQMFVGKKGEEVDVYGCSNHPEGQWSDQTDNEDGRSYAFVARGNDALEIGLAKVALPPTTVTTTTDIFDLYNIYDVLVDDLTNEYGESNVKTFLDNFLINHEPPGYFNNSGLIGAGNDVPSNTGFTSSFVDLSNLSPLIPNDVRILEVTFLE